MYYRNNDIAGSMACKYWECNTVEELIKSPCTYLNDLPEAKVTQIKDYLFNELIFKNFKFFAAKSSDDKNDKQFKYDICLHLQPRTVKLGDEIAKQGDDIRELYFFTRGEFSCGPIKDDNIAVICNLKMEYQSHRMLCENSVLNRKKMMYSIKVTGEKHAIGYCLPRRPLINIMKTYYQKRLIKLKAVAWKNAQVIKKSI